MQRLNLRHGVRDERGASAVILALLIVPLLGFAAIAVDVGAIYAERQQLQNGADAAALAIAYDCASGLPACGTSQGTAEAMTEANYDETNSSRGTPTVELGSSQVTVRNAGVQNHWFAPILGEDSTEVSARATAAWGAPGSGAAVLPLAFSWCEFEKQTGGGLPSSTTPRTIYFTKTSPAVAGTPECTGPSDLIVPGGFAWLDTDPGVCGATTEADGTAYSSTGNSVPSPCSPGYFAGLINSTVLLPIFEESGGTGANAWYRIYGYAAFHITGYSFGGQYKSTPAPCNGSDRCIQGSFTQFVDSTDEFDYDPTAPDLGARVISLIA